MEFKIIKEKILEASSKCPQAKQTLEIMFPEAFKEEVVHQAGNRYKDRSGGEFMIARYGFDRVAMINLKTGNRWSDDVAVSSGSWFDPLTEKEWATIVGGNIFTKIN